MKIDIPATQMAVPLQGEKLTDKTGQVLGVICGWGWIANDDKSPTMRPVVLAVVKGGGVLAFPAELANVTKPPEEKSVLVS